LSSDPLSTVLEAVRLKGAIYFLVDIARPWVTEAPRASVLAPAIMPGAQHLIEYHVVTRGELWGGLLDEPPVKLGAGDVIVFPQGDAHVLSTSPGMRRAPDMEMFVRQAGDSLPLRIGTGGETQIVCGFLGCDARPFNPLLSTLPRMLHVRHDAQQRTGALHSLVELALAESQGKSAGSAAMLTRMSELLFVESVRNYLRELTPEASGWLAGLRDPLVGRALAQLHARPRHAWTLDGLARAASTSRTVMAERFAHFVGLPPMQYLARWRMQLAASALLEGNPTVADVATRVGYGSEAAFSRAFKKLVGVSPAAWRGQQSAGERG
jgi:AraC-like DNA-binding protein